MSHLAHTVALRASGVDMFFGTPENRVVALKQAFDPGLAFRQGAMLGVDLLHNLLAPHRARVLEHLVLLIVVGFLGFLVWIGADMTWRVRFQTTPSLGVSISWIYLSIPVGATLALFAALAYWAEGPRRVHVETI